MDTVDVCVVGSANLDLVARCARLPGPGETLLGSDYAEHAGGKGLNQAVASARSGARTAFVGAVGLDEAGDRLRQVMIDDGIDATAVARVDAPTGRAVILVDDEGENSIVVVPGANGLVIADLTLPPAGVVLAQLEVPVATVAHTLRQARANGATTVLNPAPAAPLSAGLLTLVDVVVPNQHERELLGGSDALLAAGCGAVVTTLGGDGVELRTADDTVHLTPFEVDVVDTTGAGDAFCGALSARLAAGDDLVAAATWASAAGALAVTTAGAVPAQPRAAAIAELLETR